MLRTQHLLSLANQAREVACLTQTRDTKMLLLKIAEDYERQARLIDPDRQAEPPPVDA